MLVVLDSTVLIDSLRGRPAGARVDRLWDSGDTPATTAINAEEVVRGLRQGEQHRCDRLLAAMEILPITEHEARMAGAWRGEYARRGVTLGQADCLIAAAAVIAHATLATGNPKHFPMAELRLDHWPAGA
ncbi:MAG: PIN domain-containing protein [Sporichthyaceae bacterium]